MKKLLFFASDYKIGLSALLSDQLAALHRASADVVAVAGENEQEPGLEKRLLDDGIRLRRIEGLDAHRNFSGLVKTLAAIVADERIEVIHVQNNWQLALAAAVRLKLSLRRRFKIVYTLHGFRNNSPVKARIAQVVIGSALFLLADKVICMTKYLKGKFALLSYKIVLLPLGINDRYFEDVFTAPDTSCLSMIFPAQFRQGKSQDMIVRAFSRHVAATGDEQSRLVLPGGGQLLDEVRHLVGTLGLSSRVEFPGLLPKDSIRSAYLGCNIAVVSSNSETFGQSIVEPYVLGRCVLSRRVGIAPEIIDDGINGYLFNNEDDLADIMTMLYNNREKLVDIGRRNFECRDRFRWDVVCEEYKKCILE